MTTCKLILVCTNTTLERIPVVLLCVCMCACMRACARVCVCTVQVFPGIDCVSGLQEPVISKHMLENGYMGKESCYEFTGLMRLYTYNVSNPF